MAINLQQLRDELGNFLRANNTDVRPWIYKEPYMLQFMRGITKIKGNYPALNSVVGHVVQGFQSVWNAMGDFKIKVNELKSYHQKVNFEITPSDVENSWIAYLYDKNLKADQMPISQYIIEQELKPRVVSDVEQLIIDGEYDANDLGTFGKSMKGIVRVLFEGLNNTDNPMFRVLLSAAPTEANIVDIVAEYESKIPQVIQPFIKKIWMPKRWADAYALKYEAIYGTRVTYSDNQRMLTRLNRWEIMPYYTKQNSINLIWCTPEGNLLALRDDENKPQITDIQIQDYKLKIFMEFWLGPGFQSNQMVCVSVYTGTGSGLIDDHDTYFG
jgi:hypothetical protein